MKSIPAFIEETGRKGAQFIYLVEIVPRGSDTWSTIRLGEAAVTVDGDQFEGGFIEKIADITTRADLEAGGGIASLDAVQLKFIDNRGLMAAGRPFHEDLLNIDVEGRQVKLYLTAIPPNILRNSSFEDYTLNDFDYWTETPGDGTILATTSGQYVGSACCSMIFSSGTTAPYIESDGGTEYLKRGQGLQASWYRKATGSTSATWDVKIGTKWWNASTGLLQASPPGNATGTPSTSWALERKVVTAAVWNDPSIDSGSMLEVKIRLSKTAVDAQVLYWDAIQIELGPGDATFPTAYHPHRDEMVAADLRAVYFGEARKQRWGHNWVILETRSVQSLRHRDIPVTLIDEQLDANYVIPPDNHGKAVPITYGYFAVNPTDSLWLNPVESQGAMGLLVNWNEQTGTPVRILFDRPDIKLNSIAELFHYEPDGQKYISEYYDDRTTPNYAVREWDSDADTSSAYTSTSGSGAKWVPSGRFPLNIYLRGRRYDTKGTQGIGAPVWLPVADHEKPIDNNVSSYISCLHPGPGTIDTNSSIAYLFEPIPLRDLKLYYAYELIKILASNSAGNVYVDSGMYRTRTPTYDGRIRMYSLGVGSGGYNNCRWDPLYTGKITDFPYPSTTTEQTAGLFDSNWFDSSGLDARHQTTVYYNNSTGGDVKLFEVGTLLQGSIDILEANIYARVRGREFQDSWGSRRTAGDAIIKGVDVIESLERDELEVAGADIDTTNFDTAATARTWEAIGQVTEVRDSLDVFDEICENFGIVYFVDIDGKETVRVLGYDDPIRVLTLSDFSQGTIQIEHTGRDAIVSDYVVHYGWNPTSETFAGVAYCNKDGSSAAGAAYETKCDDAYTALGDVEHRREWNARWMGQPADAELFLKWLIDWNHQRRLRIKGEIWLNHVGLELGDLIGFYDLREYIPQGELDGKVFVIERITIRKNRGTMLVSFLEVKEP